MPTASAYPPTPPQYDAPRGKRWDVAPTSPPSWQLVDDAAAPAPAPPPAPAKPSKWPQVLAGLLVIVVGYLLYERWANPGVPPAPKPVDFVAVGKQHAPQMAKVQAISFRAMADALDANKSMADSIAAQKAAFTDAHRAAGATIDAHLATVVPVNTEPKDAAARSALSKAYRDMAQGEEGAIK